MVLLAMSVRAVHILQASQNRGRPTEEGIEIDFHVRELPRQLGVGEPAIRGMLDKLERSGLIERGGFAPKTACVPADRHHIDR